MTGILIKREILDIESHIEGKSYEDTERMPYTSQEPLRLPDTRRRG